MLAGPLAGIYDPSGTGRILFAFFAAMAATFDLLHDVLADKRGRSSWAAMNKDRYGTHQRHVDGVTAGDGYRSVSCAGRGRRRAVDSAWVVVSPRGDRNGDGWRSWVLPRIVRRAARVR